MTYLFADFTALVLKSAQEQGAVNVYGEEGYGRERVLADIAQFPPDNARVVLVNMKTCRRNYTALLQALWDKGGLSESFPSESLPSDLDLTTVFKALSESAQTVFVLFEHFDAVMNTTELDARYSDTFLEQLNSAKNKGKLKFIFATEQKYDRANFYLGEQKQFISPSHLDIPRTHRLTKAHFDNAQIEMELCRNEIYLEKTLKQLQSFLLQHSKPYLFLQFILADLKSLKTQKCSFKRCLEEWHTLFEKEQQKSLAKRINETTSKAVKTNTFTEQQVEKMKPVVTNWLPRLNVFSSFLCKNFKWFCPKE